VNGSALAALAALALAMSPPPGSASPTAADPTFRANLTRGLCLGSCPSYEVEIDSAGLVTFTGSKSAVEPSVPCLGKRQWRVTPAAVARLADVVDRSGFFGFKDEYQGAVTDMPSFSVTITRHGRTKSVRDYVGLAVGMPRAMVDIENAIDAAANDHACVFASGAPSERH
jgi:hypothetical protein